MSLREIFIENVERFMSETGMAPTIFSMRAAHDPRFYAKLRSGHACTLTVIERVEAFMASYKAQQKESA